MPIPTATLTFVSATENAITFRYGGTGWFVPADGSESPIEWRPWTGDDFNQYRTGQSEQTIYNENGCETNWNWNFVGGNGGSNSEKEETKTIKGFLSGSENTISGTLTASRTSKIKVRTYRQLRTREKIADDWTYEEEQLANVTYRDGTDKDIGTATETLIFYTKPDKFFWDVFPSKDVSIYQVLTATKWNELMDKAVQRYNWKYCQQNSGNAPKAIGQNQVTPGTFVSADIYNNGASLCGINTKVTAEQSVIYASLFTDLSDAVNAD